MIEWLIYPQEFKEVVERLKREGRLRRNGLSRIHRRFYLLSAAFLLLWLPMIWVADSLELKALIVACIGLIPVWIVRSNVRDWVMPYTVGEFRTGTITSKVRYGMNGAWGGQKGAWGPRGWYFQYRCNENQTRHPEFDEKEREMYPIPKSWISAEDPPQKGQVIEMFHMRNGNKTLTVPLFEKGLERWCMDQKRLEKYRKHTGE